MTQTPLMPTRRRLLTAGAGLAAATAVLPLTVARADETATLGNGTADFLFVQTADSIAFAADDNRLTLVDVSPSTLFFSDRPERIAGNMTTERFVPFWSEGSDSFLKDPPNADLSVIVDGKLQQAVVVLRDPQLENGNLSYAVEILSGDMPELAQNASLFIDIIGMPLTPVSVAGAARRGYRRAALY